MDKGKVKKVRDSRQEKWKGEVVQGEKEKDKEKQEEEEEEEQEGRAYDFC